MPNYPDGVSDQDIDKHFESAEDRFFQYKITMIHENDVYMQTCTFKSPLELSQKLSELETQGYIVRSVKRVKANDG